MDYYKTLNLKIDSSKKEIISKYKELLNQYSPTAFENQRTANQFKLIYKAYYILSDEFRRENYNKFYLANDFESEEFKLWHKNQFKKMRTQTDTNKALSFIEITGDIAGEAILGGIFEGAFTVVFETIGSIFD